MGERLRGARKARGYSQADVAKRSGVPQPTISKIERWERDGGITDPGALYIFSLARALRVDLAWVIGGEGSPEGEAQSTGSFSGPQPPALDDAVESIAEVLIGLSPLGRELAKTLLSNLATNPEEHSRTTETLHDIAKTHGRSPTLPPSAPPRKRVGQSANARRPAAAAAKLEVVRGEGRPTQLSLSLQKAIAPSKDPFDATNAPEEEARCYAQWTAPRRANVRKG